MNKERRKAINAIYAELETLDGEVSAAVAPLVAKMAALMERIEEIKSDEEEAYENMPESLQEGERGQIASEAIDNLDNAYNELESKTDSLNEFGEEPFREILEYLDNAAGEG